MKLVFLGTASCYPTPTRGVSCTALQHDDGSVWIFDCGEGSQIQLQRSCIKAGKITKIFITHLHGDHLYGLPGLLCTLGNGLDPEKAKESVIELYGPVGIRKFIQVTLGLSRSPLAFRLAVCELEPRPDMFPPDWGDWPVENNLQESPLPQECSYRRVEYQENCWHLLETKNVCVKAAALKHRIPSFGFIISEKDGPGKLDSNKLLELGIKAGPIYGKLKFGHKVTLDSGQELDPNDFLGPPVKGRKVAIMGDTCDSSEIFPIAQDLDILVHESTMENKLETQCVEFGHSTPRMASDVAVSCNTRHLVLFHLSPRYRPVSLCPEEGSVDSANILYLEAIERLKEMNRPDMNLTVAEDFTEITVPRRTRR